MEKIPENASLIRRKQMTLLVLVVLGLFVISIGLVLLPSGGKVEAPKKESEQNLEVVLTDLTQGAKA